MKNGSTPLVSIITVCFNSEQTIEQTIKSVLGQTYKNVEYIIVDGQSTDGTLGIVNKYKSQIAKVVSEPDDGLYYAMNKGISMATGDIVGIINSDDWYEPYTVEEVVACFHETNAELVYGDMLVIEDKGTKLMTTDNLEDLRVNMVVPHSTVFIQKEVYALYGVFDVRYKIAADYDLMIRLYNMGIKFVRVKKVLAYFRMGGASTLAEELTVTEVAQIARKYCKGTPEERAYLLERIDNISKGYYFEKKLKYNSLQIASNISLILQENGMEEVGIFGCGTWGTTVGRILSDIGIAVSYYVDNAPEKWGKVINGVKVIEPQSLHKASGLVLILVNGYSKEILSQIEQMNNSNVKSISWESLL